MALAGKYDYLNLCVVLYLKIINTFLKIICASYGKLSKELKTSIKI